MPKPLTMDHNKLWKILQDVEIPDHLTCLLRNLYAGQEATVRTGRGTTDWFQIGKGVPKDDCWANKATQLFINMSLPSGMAATLMFNWNSQSNSKVSFQMEMFLVN